MESLLQEAKANISPEIVREAARVYGEAENNVSKAIGALFPTILVGLLEKSSAPGSNDFIFTALSKVDPAVLDNLNSLFGGGNLAHKDPKDISGQWLGSIFGAKIPALTNAVAAFSGVKPSTASALLGFSAPLVMGLLNKRIRAEGLSAPGLVSFLHPQRNSILSLLPANVASLLGAANIAGYHVREEKLNTGLRWLWPLLMLLGLGAALVYYLKN